MSSISTKQLTRPNILSPSPLSAVLCVSLAAASVLLNRVEVIRNYLQVPSNIGIFKSVAAAVDHLLTSLLGQSRVNVLVVGLFWALVGLGVYILLRGLARNIGELDNDIAVRKYVWPKGADRARPLKITAQRTFLRILAAIGLGVVLLGPLAATLHGPVFVDLIGDNLALQYTVWFIVSLLLWHSVVVLLRLIILRPRLFDQT